MLHSLGVICSRLKGGRISPSRLLIICCRLLFVCSRLLLPLRRPLPLAMGLQLLLLGLFSLQCRQLQTLLLSLLCGLLHHMLWGFHTLLWDYLCRHWGWMSLSVAIQDLQYELTGLLAVLPLRLNSTAGRGSMTLLHLLQPLLHLCVSMYSWVGAAVAFCRRHVS